MVVGADLQIRADGSEFLPDGGIRPALLLPLLLKIRKEHLCSHDADADLDEFSGAGPADKKRDGQDIQRFHGQIYVVQWFCVFGVQGYSFSFRIQDVFGLDIHQNIIEDI